VNKIILNIRTEAAKKIIPNIRTIVAIVIRLNVGTEVVNTVIQYHHPLAAITPSTRSDIDLHIFLRLCLFTLLPVL
jgi:hypothetical protein